MDNNDILIRLRYALDIKDIDMVEIFKLGGIDISKKEVQEILSNSKDSYHDEDDNDGDIINNHEDTGNSNDDVRNNNQGIYCDNYVLNSFLNGFIIFKRGKREPKPGQTERPILSIKENEDVNNVMLKKLKIALSLKSKDMIDILEKAGVSIRKTELSALFRKKGHRNYMECGDKYARNFLKGLTIKYRK